MNTNRLERALGVGMWGSLGAGVLTGVIAGLLGHSGSTTDILLITMVFFYATSIPRLLIVATRRPQRRAPLITLTVGIILWATGSAILNASGNHSLDFPAPGEWLFLAAYAAIATYLVMDAGSRQTRTMTAWTDAVILCGGVGIIAGFMIIGPLRTTFPDGGVPLLVALLYPLLDLGLALLIVGQWTLGLRQWTKATTFTVLGFVSLAAADSSLVLSLQSKTTYDYTILLDTLWGIGFGLLITAACMPRKSRVSTGKSLPASVLVGSFIIAMTLLTVRPYESIGYALALPALLVLCATGVRLSVALKDAKQANSAFQLAQTDDLTNLPNRRAVIRRLDKTIEAKEPVGLMLLDLDGFKEVNDTLGHDAGDRLLQLIALRLRDFLPQKTMLARLGGDEFAILTHEDDHILLLEAAQGIRQTLLEPAKVDGVDISMNASLGITTRNNDDTQSSDLLRRADVAMYDAKSSRGGAQLYDAGHDEFSLQRLRMGEDLRNALKRQHITVWYQPKICTKTRRITGVEALVRWENPEVGMIPPIAFLGAARRAGLMQELSEVVTRKALSDIATWRDHGLMLGVAINLAPPELLSGKMLPVINHALELNRLDASILTIEVTEETFLNDPQRAKVILDGMHGQGLKVSIDDFGTGFSSLSYLRDLPITELKLDRSFVMHVASDERNRLIVASTVDMAHALDLNVVAEGVETPEIAEAVSKLGANTIQGYLISPPMPAGKVEDWVNNWNNEHEVPEGTPVTW